MPAGGLKEILRDSMPRPSHRPTKYKRKGISLYLNPELCDRLGIPENATAKEAIAVLMKKIKT